MANVRLGANWRTETHSRATDRPLCLCTLWCSSAAKTHSSNVYKCITQSLLTSAAAATAERSHQRKKDDKKYLHKLYVCSPS